MSLLPSQNNVTTTILPPPDQSTSMQLDQQASSPPVVQSTESRDNATLDPSTTVKENVSRSSARNVDVLPQSLQRLNAMRTILQTRVQRQIGAPAKMSYTIPSSLLGKRPQAESLSTIQQQPSTQRQQQIQPPAKQQFQQRSPYQSATSNTVRHGPQSMGSVVRQSIAAPPQRNAVLDRFRQTQQQSSSSTSYSGRQSRFMT